MFAKPQSLIIIVAVAVIAAGDVPTADAQGILQRLGNRIRDRVVSPYVPAPVPGTNPNLNQPRYNPNPDTPQSEQYRSLQPQRQTVPPISGGRPSSNESNPNESNPSASKPGGPNTGEPTPLAPIASSSGSVPPARSQAPSSASRSNDDLGSSILAPQNGPGFLAESDRRGINEASRVRTTGERATIGIRVLDPRPETPDVLVVSFNESSRADEAGMQRGDAILAIDGVPTPNIAAIAAELATREPGEVVQIQIGRRNRTMLLPVQLVSAASTTLERTPSSGNDFSGETAATKGDASLAMGSSVQSVPPSDIERPAIGIEVEEPKGSRGAVVVSVAPDSPADSSGIRVGDRIVAVDDRFVVDTNRLAENIEKRKDPLAPMSVRLVRDDELVDLIVLLDGSTPPVATSETPQDNDTGGSILGGLGSKLGGLFGGQSVAAKLSDADPSAARIAPRNSAAGETDGNATLDADLPEPMPLVEAKRPSVAPELLTAEARDLLDFSDGEPIDQVIFEEAAASDSLPARKANQRQPESRLQANELAGSSKKGAAIASENEVLQELRAEIERLQRRLDLLEKAKK